MTNRYWQGCALAAGLALTCNAMAQPQAYPTKPVRLVVPFPPGGAVDVIGRIVTSRLSERLGQQVVIDNRGGANAIIGTEIVAKAAPDGYTLLIVPSGHAITPSVTRKLPYDTLKDFAPVGLVGTGAYVLVVNMAVPAKSIAEFIALAKARPGQLNYAVTGHGNATHLAGELFKVLAGIDMLGITYKGGGPALTDVIGGQVDAMFAPVAIAGPFLRTGKLRGLAIAGNTRSTVFPEIPTVAESGVPGFSSEGWYGIIAPAGTPKAVVDRLNEAASKALAQPQVRQALEIAGNEPVSMGPAEFDKFIRVEIPRWTAVIQRAKIEQE